MNGLRIQGAIRRCGSLPALLIGTTLLLIACRSAESGSPGEGGGLAPPLTLATLDGGSATLDEFRGQPVVLNFWASWCVPCRSEMLYFDKAARAYADRGVRFLGVAVADDPESARAFAQEFGISYPLGLDNGAIVRSYQIVGLPSTVFIARGGMVAKHWPGVITEQDLIALVEEIAR